MKSLNFPNDVCIKFWTYGIARILKFTVWSITVIKRVTWAGSANLDKFLTFETSYIAAIIDQRISIAKLKNIWKKIGVSIVANNPLFPVETVFYFYSKSS